MRIRVAKPPKGKREPICEGDEARVSRITTGKFKGLVERLQPFRPELSPMQKRHLAFCDGQEQELIVPGFPFSVMGEEDTVFYSTKVSYHVLKALAGRCAFSMFPENFVNTHELRFFQNNDGLQAATYSDFVPDDTGVIARIKAVKERYYAAMRDNNMDASERIKAELDEAELVGNPKIAVIRNQMEELGIFPSHPEANYHLNGGKTVFFEINSIDARKLFISLATDPKRYEEQMGDFASFFTAALRFSASFTAARGWIPSDLLAMSFQESYNLLLTRLLDWASIGEGELATSFDLSLPCLLTWNARLWVMKERMRGNSFISPVELDGAMESVLGDPLSPLASDLEKTGEDEKGE
ncbi:MAG: hypothetical protein ABIH29_05975 [Candidatus Micrarchaeota archaeon]